MNKNFILTSLLIFFLSPLISSYSIDIEIHNPLEVYTTDGIGDIYFNFTITPIDEVVSNYTFFIYSSNGSLLYTNMTEVGQTEPFTNNANINLENDGNFPLEEGNYTWFIQSCGNTPEVICGVSENRTIIIKFQDTIPPHVTIHSPINLGIEAYSTHWILVNCSAKDDDGLFVEDVIYCIDNNQNCSIPPEIVYFSNGQHFVTCYAKDNNNNDASSTTAFIVRVLGEEGTQIYDSFNGISRGLGIFLEYLTIALPPLLLGLAIVSVVIIFIWGIVFFIRHWSNLERVTQWELG